MAGCNSIIGIGPPGAAGSDAGSDAGGVDDAATTDAAAVDAPASDGGTDAAAPIDASTDGAGVLTVFGGVSSIGGGVNSATTLKLVNAGFEIGETACATPGGLCVRGGLTP